MVEIKLCCTIYFTFLESKFVSKMGFLKGKPLYLDAQATTPLVSIDIDIQNRL
jgi:hypothetical protein